MSDVIKLSGVGVDCPDAGELAAFYAEITGGTVTSQNERWASMSGPGGTIDFWSVPNHRPAAWPDGTTPKQLHLDFYVDDLEATEAKVLAGRRLEVRLPAQLGPLLRLRRPGRTPLLPFDLGQPRRVTMSAPSLTRCFDAVILG